MSSNYKVFLTNPHYEYGEIQIRESWIGIVYDDDGVYNGVNGVNKKILNQQDHELRSDGYIYDKNSGRKLPVKCLGSINKEMGVKIHSLEDVSISFFDIVNGQKTNKTYFDN